MKILLTGFFHENLGDDLFFHLITARYPQHTFYMNVHADHANAYAGKPNVKLLRQTKPLRGLNKLLTALSPKLGIPALTGKFTDISVLIGGSMFQEHAGGLARLAQMPRHKKGLYVLGINFGPYQTQTYLDHCRQYLAEAKDVCFRDSISYEHFSQLPNTRLGSDMVFGIESLYPAAKTKENTCVISLMDFSANPALANYAQDYFRFMQDMISHQQSLGRKVILVSFCQWEGDRRAIEQLLRQLPQTQNLSTLYYDGKNAHAICQAISASACVVASRFHSMVLGLAYGIPTIAISYSNKTRQLLADLGKDSFAIAPEALKNTCARDARPITDVDLDRCKAQAQSHFAALDDLLN